MPNNFYSIAVPADSYYNGTVIINGSLTTLNWTPIRDTNGVITGYGYNTPADGSSTISHSHPNGRIYVSAYGFAPSGGYGYLTGTDLKPLLFVTFNSSSYFTTESNGQVLLYIERSNRLSEVVTVTVKTKSSATTTSPANENSDYIPVNQTIAFSARETVKTFFITIINDGVTEETEYFDVVIETVVDAMPFEIDRTTIAIEDNDNLHSIADTMVLQENTSVLISNQPSEMEQLLVKYLIPASQIQVLEVTGQ
uniref:Calx-beta domain-containing protein n=1 Tax=Amphimedon queenslandica TaxID=400682 RepID=A0A1X7VPI4_AMPQE